MSSLNIGNGNWAVKEDNLLGFRYDETEGVFLPREMTFSRACDATRVNPDGLIERVPYNLLSNSEEFTTGNGWFASTTGGSTASQTSNYGVAPNGTTTADRIQLALNGQVYADWVSVPSTGIIVGQVYTYSIYLKSLSGTPSIYFFSDGVSNVLKTITTEWVRYDYTFTATSTSIYPRFLLQSGSSTSADLLAWGYQLNDGSTAKDYFPTTNRQDIARIDYSSGTGALLLEKQSTNLSAQSQDFNGWANKVNITTTANYETSPDGTQNASRLQFTANGFMYGNTGFGQTSGTVYTLSCWAKRNGSGSQSVGFFIDGSGGVNSAWSLSSEYQRFTYTFTAGNNSTVGIAGASGADVSVWGWQFEASSYATSYIPTTSASVTRLADQCYKTGVADWIGQTEGTIYLEANMQQADKGWGEVLRLQGATGADSIILYFNPDGLFYFEVAVGGVAQASGYLSTDGGNLKIAIAYKANDFNVYVNGSSDFSDTSGSVPACSQIYLLSTAAITKQGRVNQATIYKTRLSNSELASLTTI